MIPCLSLWLLLPVKPFAEAKSRLADVLTAPERANLMRCLLERTLDVARQSELFAGIIVVSRDPQVQITAAPFAVEWVDEEEADLNAALEQARRVAHARGASAVLALPADLPLLTAADLAALCDQAAAEATVVISRSRDGGTNALYIDKSVPLPFSFGPESFARHCAAAQALGARVARHHSATLEFDLDSPADLAEWRLAVQDCPQPL